MNVNELEISKLVSLKRMLMIIYAQNFPKEENILSDIEKLQNTKIVLKEPLYGLADSISEDFKKQILEKVKPANHLFSGKKRYVKIKDYQILLPVINNLIYDSELEIKDR